MILPVMISRFVKKACGLSNCTRTDMFESRWMMRKLDDKQTEHVIGNGSIAGRWLHGRERDPRRMSSSNHHHPPPQTEAPSTARASSGKLQCNPHGTPPTAIRMKWYEDPIDPRLMLG